jgi:hypothetical protein
MKYSLPAFTLLTLAACANPPLASAPPVSQQVQPTSTPVDHTSAATTVTAAPPADPAPVPVAPVFQAVGAAPSDARLHPLEGALLVARETAPIASDEEGRQGNPVGMLQGGTIVYPEELFLDGWFHRIVTIQGRYPDDVHMLAVGDTGRTGIAEHFVFDSNKGWQAKNSNVGSWYVGMARFGNSQLGLTAPVMWGSAELVTLRGPRVKAKLSTAKGCPEGEWQARGSSSRIIPAALTSTSGGELLAFGRDCQGPPAFEVWKPGAVRSDIIALPAGGSEGIDLESEVVLTAGVANDAWLLPDGERLFHYQDGAVTSVTLPSARPCSDATVTHSGALWLLCSGRAFERVGENWEPRLAPNDLLLDDIAAARDGSVWALGGGLLLQAAANAAVAGKAPGVNAAQSLALPVQASAGADAIQRAQRKRLPRLGGPHCATNLVVLYGFTKTTPKDYDFPLTRKALRGHPEFAAVRFVVTRDVGQRFFSAMVPNYEVGKQLQALIQRELKGSKPQVVCAEPEIEREVAIDLSPIQG